MLFRSSWGSAASCLEAASNFVGVVDPPLESSEGTDHEDTGTETVPESLESDFTVDLFDLLTSWFITRLLVQNGDHGICGMGNQSAEDTSPVTGQERYHKLSVFAVLILGLGEDVSIECLHSVLEGAELDHSVGDLSSPEWAKTLVESVDAFPLINQGHSFSGGFWESTCVSCLHADFELHERIIIKNKT